MLIEGFYEVFDAYPPDVVDTEVQGQGYRTITADLENEFFQVPFKLIIVVLSVLDNIVIPARNKQKNIYNNGGEGIWLTPKQKKH